MNSKSGILLLLALSLVPLTRPVLAAESQFAFVYTTDLLPKGEKEIEQWATWRHQKIGGSYDLLEGKTAYEYGLNDDVQVALYASYAWTHANRNGPGGATTPAEQFGYDSPGPTDNYSATRFIGLSFEEIWRLYSPYTNPVGVALYMEPTVGSKFLELETRLILQKNFLDDTLVFGFNFTYAPEFRQLPNDDGTTGERWQEEADINFTLAGSYRFAPNLSAGFEFLNEREYAALDFSNLANNGYFI